MQVWVNGQPHNAEEGATISTLLSARAIDPVKVAVERNEEVVPRRTFAECVLQEGDRIEIVTFVGGG